MTGKSPPGAGSGAAAAGRTKLPHAGAPLPGGSVRPAPWWETWRTKLAEGGANMSKNWKQTTKTWKKQGKFQMPVHVDVDFLTPAMDTVKENASSMWRQLPPPVQQNAPIVAAALTTAFIVHRIERGRLVAERDRNQRLRGRVDSLLVENEQLHQKLADLKAKAQGPRSPSEITMARALSEATQAAAAAATAAAQAASACRPKPPLLRPA